jgi:ATP-dependent helicase YprA (DUF1998 family)
VPLAIAGPSSRLTGGEVAAPAGVVAAVREYNEKHRQKSLLELHAERQAKGGKDRKREGPREKEKKKGKEGEQERKNKGQKRPAAGEQAI